MGSPPLRRAARVNPRKSLARSTSTNFTKSKSVWRVSEAKAPDTSLVADPVTPLSLPKTLNSLRSSAGPDDILNPIQWLIDTKGWCP